MISLLPQKVEEVAERVEPQEQDTNDVVPEGLASPERSTDNNGSVTDIADAVDSEDSAPSVPTPLS